MSCFIYLFIHLFIYLFIYLWLCLVFVSARGLSPALAQKCHSSSRCAGLSLSRPLLLRSTGSRRAGSVIVAHGLSYSAACGIFPDQGLNPCPLHWQADSQPLRHQGSPPSSFLMGSVLAMHFWPSPGYCLPTLLVLPFHTPPWGKSSVSLSVVSVSVICRFKVCSGGTVMLSCSDKKKEVT